MIRPALTVAATAALIAAGPASAAGVKLTSASSLDRDRDGRVDAVRALFSAKVKGKGRFAVSGLTVTAVGRPRGRAVLLQIAEGPQCDVGLLPRVRYRGGLRRPRGRRVRPSKLNMERRNRLAPRLSCAVTADEDGDGRVDGLALTFSKAVSGGTASAFSVSGYQVRGTSAPRGRHLDLTLVERDGHDGGATPSVTYERVKRGGVRGRGGQALPGSLGSTLDGVAPVLATARTSDSDADGLIDTVYASFSEPVSLAPAAGAVSGTFVTGSSAEGGDVTLGLVEGLDTGALPELSYDAGEVIDQAGNLGPATKLAVADGAGPVMTAARTEDRDGDGRLDTLSLTFSEPVSHPADADGGYPVEVSGYGLVELSAADGKVLQIALDEGATADTGVRPTVRYVPGAGSPVLDGAGNEALARTLAGATDGAAPRLIGATTVDVDEDGRLDRIRYRFSEPVLHLLGPGAFAAQGLTALAPLAAQGDVIEVALTEAAGANTGLKPHASYVPAGPGSVSDIAGNLAPGGSVSAVDGAGPVVVDASTGDADSDHRIDRVFATFSEPISYAGDASAPFALGAQGFAVASVSAASGSSLTLSLVEPDQADTGSAPAVSYAGGGGLEDVAGVEAVARTYAGVTRDTLAPAFLAPETADVDGDGRIDRVDLLYSEDVQGGSGATPFAVSGRTVTGVEFSGARARIVIAEAGSPDTADRPSASYAPPAAPAERVRDIAEGAGDSPQDAPAQSLVQSSDRAKPAIVQALTGDELGTADGRLDRVTLTFSEPVTHAAEPTGPFGITLEAPHAVSSVGAATGNVIVVQATQSPLPDGGSTPDVTVSDPSKVFDAADNPAYGGAFSGTADGVRPAILSARLGEVDGAGACAFAPPQNARVDCMSVRWSEPVTHPDDPSLTIGGFTVNGPIPGTADALVTNVPLVEGATPDRSATGTVAYTAPAGVPVLDAAGLEAIDTAPSIPAVAACGDDTNEENDSRLGGNPFATDPFAAFLCASDEDWYRITPESSALHVMMNPDDGRLLTLEIWDATGGSPLASATAGAAGDPVILDVDGPLADSHYWLRVSGVDPTQEGEYCLDPRYVLGDSCLGGGGEPL